MIEREKKWLIRLDLTKLHHAYEAFHIRQGYAEVGNPEVRVRLVEDSRESKIGKLTTKWDRFTGERTEHEVEIPFAAAFALYKLTEHRVTKKRYLFPGGFELDLFGNRWNGLVLLEREYTKEEWLSDREFMLPQCVNEVVAEVTDDPRFKNKWLARQDSRHADLFRSIAYDPEYGVDDLELSRCLEIAESGYYTKHDGIAVSGWETAQI